MKTASLAAIAVTLWCAASAAAASSPCSQTLSRESVVACALSASLLAQAEHESSLALRGKQLAVGALLPSNPLLSVSGAQRVAAGGDATNWYAQLAQEIEIGGQRRSRQAAVASEERAQENATRGLERDIAAMALRVYFEVLAARDLLQWTERTQQAFDLATAASKAAAEHGVSAGIDADLAELTSVRLEEARILAHRRLLAASAELTSLVGLDPARTSVRVEGELAPLPQVEVEKSHLIQQALAQRPEIAAADATRASLEGWADSYRRARLPNVTLSVFAQRDGFNERVLGGGLALPIPLPGSLGRNFAGETAENAAMARRARALFEQTRREVRLEVQQAVQALVAAREAQALYTEERVTRAHTGLGAIARGIAAGTLTIRDMIVPQQALMDFLGQYVTAKLTLCLASVELARAAGLPLVQGVR